MSDLKLVSSFNVQKWPVSDSSGGPMARNLHFEITIEGLQDSRKSSDCTSGTSSNFKKRFSHGCWHS